MFIGQVPTLDKGTEGTAWRVPTLDEGTEGTAWPVPTLDEGTAPQKTTEPQSPSSESGPEMIPKEQKCRLTSDETMILDITDFCQIPKPTSLNDT